MLARVNVIPVVSVMLPTPVIVTTLALVIVAVPTLELAEFICVGNGYSAYRRAVFRT